MSRPAAIIFQTCSYFFNCFFDICQEQHSLQEFLIGLLFSQCEPKMVICNKSTTINNQSRLTSSISAEGVNTAIEASLTTWLMWPCSHRLGCKMWRVSSSTEKWWRGYDSRLSSSAISEQSWWCPPSPGTEDSADWPWRYWRPLNWRSESSWSDPQGHIVSLRSCYLKYFLSEMYWRINFK